MSQSSPPFFSTLKKPYPVPKHGIVVKLDPDGARVADIRNSTMIFVNDSGTRILQLCNGTRTIDEICNTVREGRNRDRTQLEEEILDFLRELDKLGYIVFRRVPTSARVTVVGSKHYHIPSEVILEITSKCNLKCKHCYTKSSTVNVKELDTQKWLEILSDLHQSGVIGLTITGGEPSLRADLLDIVAFCSKRFSVCLKTNGCNIKRKLMKILTKPSVNVQVSLYGSTAETHEKVTGIAGSFEKATNTMQLLSKEKVRLAASMIVTPDNIPELERTLKLAIDLGANGFRVGTVMSCSRGTARMELCKDELIKLNQSLSSLTGKYEKIWIDRGEVPHMIGDTTPTVDCGAGYNLIAISPDGRVKPCEFFDDDFTLGNLSHNRPQSIWKSRVVDYYKNLAHPCKRLCSTCEKLYICRGCIARGFAMLKMGGCRWTNAIAKPRPRRTENDNLEITRNA